MTWTDLYLMSIPLALLTCALGTLPSGSAKDLLIGLVLSLTPIVNSIITLVVLLMLICYIVVFIFLIAEALRWLRKMNKPNKKR